MTHQDSEAKIIEPLAKFHAKVHSQHRVTFPKETRELFDIKDGDYVVVILRKIQGRPPKVIKRAVLFLKISRNGVFILPKGLVNDFEISIGDIIELLFIRHIPAPRINVPELSTVEALAISHKRGYVPISKSQEEKIIADSLKE